MLFTLPETWDNATEQKQFYANFSLVNTQS